MHRRGCCCCCCAKCSLTHTAGDCSAIRNDHIVLPFVSALITIIARIIINIFFFTFRDHDDRNFFFLPLRKTQSNVYMGKLQQSSRAAQRCKIGISKSHHQGARKSDRGTFGCCCFFLLLSLLAVLVVARTSESRACRRNNTNNNSQGKMRNVNVSFSFLFFFFSFSMYLYNKMYKFPQ